MAIRAWCDHCREWRVVKKVPGKLWDVCTTCDREVKPWEHDKRLGLLDDKKEEVEQ